MQVCLVGSSHELGNQTRGCGLATTTPPRVTVSLNRSPGPPGPHAPSRRRPLSFLYLLCFELGRLALTERPRPPYTVGSSVRSEATMAIVYKFIHFQVSFIYLNKEDLLSLTE